MPLLLLRKKDCSCSSLFVAVKVPPVAELNLFVCSCSSERMARVSRFSPYFVPSLEPDFTEGAKPTFLAPFFRGVEFKLPGESGASFS